MSGYKYNIVKDIKDKADELGLDFIGTGGGCDYVIANLSKDGKEYPIIVLVGINDPQPDNLYDLCQITYYFDENWERFYNALSQPIPAYLALYYMAQMMNEAKYNHFEEDTNQNRCSECNEFGFELFNGLCGWCSSALKSQYGGIG